MLLLALSTVAHAVPVCSASQVCAAGVDPCVISAQYEITSGCTLDFGGVALQVTTSGRLDSLGTATVRARSMTELSGGQLRARDGTSLTMSFTGDASFAGSLDGSTDLSGGAIEVHAGTITVTHAVSMNSRTAVGDGSSLTLHGRDEVFLSSSIDAHGGSQGMGGTIALVSDGPITVGGSLDASGGEFDGGTVYVDAGGPASFTAGTVNASGGGDAGWGGVVFVHARGDLTIDVPVRAHGDAGTYGSGGDGGEITLWSGGLLDFTQTVEAKGAAGDGYGGVVRLIADDAVVDGAVDVLGAGAYSGGGVLDVDVLGDVTFLNPVDVSGGDGGGGEILVTAASATVSSNLNAMGGGAGGSGGTIDLMVGDLVLTARLDPRADATGSGGDVRLEVCDLWIGATGSVTNDRVGGGTDLVVHESVTVDGDLSAATGNTLTYRRGTPVIGGTANITPAFSLVHDPLLSSCVCPAGDADGDQVCDAVDVCPGGDDTVDTNGDGWPDACPLRVASIVPGTAGVSNTLTVTGATPGGVVLVAASRNAAQTPVPGCPGLFAAMSAPGRVFQLAADGTGTATLVGTPNVALAGLTYRVQAIDAASCRISPLVLETL